MREELYERRQKRLLNQKLDGKSLGQELLEGA